MVEGARLVGRALAAGLVPEEVYGDGTVELPGVDMISVDPAILDRVSYRKRSEGVIAVFAQFPADTLTKAASGDPALILVGESLEKPGNLGAILRTADAVAADAVVTVPRPLDRFNPNVIRSSTGACFTVPVVSSDIEGLAAYAADSGVTLVAADPNASVSYWEADLTGPVALVVGSEDAGISPFLRESSDRAVAVPMRGSVDSLNASVTMALLAYEALRQREATLGA